MAPAAFIVPLQGGHQHQRPVLPLSAPREPGSATGAQGRHQQQETERSAPEPPGPKPAQQAEPTSSAVSGLRSPDPADWGEKGLFPSVHAWKGDRRERPLTIPLIHHSLDDHWKHAPVQVKVQLRRKGGDNSQTELEGAGGMSRRR